jgi:hypothetical protein
LISRRTGIGGDGGAVEDVLDLRHLDARQPTDLLDAVLRARACVCVYM